MSTSSSSSCPPVFLEYLQEPTSSLFSFPQRQRDVERGGRARDTESVRERGRKRERERSGIKRREGRETLRVNDRLCLSFLHPSSPLLLERRSSITLSHTQKHSMNTHKCTHGHIPVPQRPTNECSVLELELNPIGLASCQSVTIPCILTATGRMGVMGGGGGCGGGKGGGMKEQEA